ncbi:MAG: adenylate/guanylate cyclase domain-containing protein [Acidobacteriota bacterium]
MRNRVSFKIFSIALCLVVVLVVVAALSSRNISRVRDELVATAEYYIPLEQASSRVTFLELEQDAIYQRILLLYAGARDRAAIEAQKQLFEARGQKVDEEMHAATRLVEQGLQQATGQEERLEFTRLQPLFRGLERQHQDLHDLVLKIEDRLERNDENGARALEEVEQREQREFDEAVGAIRTELEKLSHDSSLQAANDEQRILQLNLLITIAAAIVGLLLAALITSGLVRPIRRLLAGTQAIQKGDLETEIPVTSSDEIGLLTESFNSMVGELRVKERIKATFGKYVDPRIVEGLIGPAGATSLEADRRVVTVFFSDIAGFTSISERLTPAGLVKLINHYFTRMDEPIVRHGGIVDKYIGDSIMAFWGPPFVSETEHARLACLAALEQFDQLEDFQRTVPELIGLRRDVPVVGIRIGIATGDVVVGNIGSDRTMGYTVMGDTVNLASRLEGASKLYGTRMLISQETQRLAADAVETREVDSIRVVGKSEPIRVFELLARTGTLAPALAEMRSHFEQGLRAYRQRAWDEATKQFTTCLKLVPQDGPSALFLKRIQAFAISPPPEHWDGVWTMTEK